MTTTYPIYILDLDGKDVATFDGSRWQTPDEKYRGFQWRNPMVTSSEKHPHPNHG